MVSCLFWLNYTKKGLGLPYCVDLIWKWACRRYVNYFSLLYPMMYRYGLWLAAPTCWHRMRSCGKRNSLQMWRSCLAICVTPWPTALTVTMTPLMIPGTKPRWCHTAFLIMLQCRCTTTGRRKPGNGSLPSNHSLILLWEHIAFMLWEYSSLCGDPGSINKKKNSRTRRHL